MAQNLMVCQFCETSNEPKYKCVNCDLILCEGCKIKIHTKIKKTEVHQVLDLKEFSNLGASETIRHLDLKDIQCSIHNTEQCIIYCEDCKVLLCAVCLLESHQTHTLAKIAEVYHKKVKELQELENKIHQELPFYADLEKELKQMKSVENDQYNEIKQRILKKESELKENITKQRDNLITELDNLWKPREEEMSRQLTDTVEKCDALARNKAQIEETFQSHNPTENVLGIPVGYHWDSLESQWGEKIRWNPTGMFWSVSGIPMGSLSRWYLSGISTGLFLYFPVEICTLSFLIIPLEFGHVFFINI